MASSPDLGAAEIGKAWLNYIIEGRTILWWGGNGDLDRAYRLAAPEARACRRRVAGRSALNGRTVAEQIGAQIFIDGWAMVAPGEPELAARLAEQAARVSHDGEAVHAAKLWAAMEAQAFGRRTSTSCSTPGSRRSRATA